MNIFDKFMKGLVSGVLKFTCKVIYGLKVYGIENVPKEGNIIFCGNHRTWIDAFFIYFTAPRDMRFMAKEELAHNKFMSYLGRIFNVIFVKRDSKDLSAIKTSLKTLKSGDCLGIFPEGTRNGLEKNDGQIKNGAAYLALKTDSTIVPIGIIGGDKPFKKSYIFYGKPIEMAQFNFDGKVGEKEEQEVSDRLKGEIIKLSTQNVKMLHASK